jgi:two-component sensor histidine kinase
MSVSEQTHSITLTVQDEGPGLPDEFTMKGAQTLGMRIISALAEQMGASLTGKSTHPGAEFVAEIPVEPYKH